MRLKWNKQITPNPLVITICEFEGTFIIGNQYPIDLGCGKKLWTVHTKKLSRAEARKKVKDIESELTFSHKNEKDKQTQSWMTVSR